MGCGFVQNVHCRKEKSDDFDYRNRVKYPNPGQFLRAVAPKNQAAPVLGAGHGGSEAGPET